MIAIFFLIITTEMDTIQRNNNNKNHHLMKICSRWKRKKNTRTFSHLFYTRKTSLLSSSLVIDNNAGERNGKRKEFWSKNKILTFSKHTHTYMVFFHSAGSFLILYFIFKDNFQCFYESFFVLFRTKRSWCCCQL